MDPNYRIIDANLNRVSEALRVIEEVSRFKLNNKDITENFKNIRHKINNVYSEDYLKLISARDSERDIGTQIDNISSRTNIMDILKANFKRAQQALRVLEEYSKSDDSSIVGFFESLRYDLYTLEKQMANKALEYYRKKRLENCNLYLVTDRSEFSDNNKFFDVIASAIKGGVDIVQLREKNATTKEFMELARTLKDICSNGDCLFIINDRIDIAMAVKSDGVHLGQEDMDLKTAREILGEEKILGLSTHKPDDTKIALLNRADYIGVGPVYTTPTKPGRPAVGLEYVSWASKNISIPFFAIGGINSNNLNDVIKAGATRIAAVRAIINDKSPESIAQYMKDKLSNTLVRS